MRGARERGGPVKNELPYFRQIASGGTARLHGRAPESTPQGGTNTSSLRVRDIQLVHLLVTDAEQAPVNDLFPGFEAIRDLSVDSASDGVRTLQWSPAKGTHWTGDCDIEILSRHGDLVYAGSGTVRRVKVDVSRNGVLATVTARLLNVDPDVHGVALSKALGEEVQWAFDKALKRAPAAPANQGALPLGTPAGMIDLNSGEVAVWSDEVQGDGAGRVVTVGPEQVIVTEQVLGDPAPVQRSAIVGVYQLAGPKGGSPDQYLRLIAESAAAEGVTVTYSHVLSSVFIEAGAGLEPLEGTGSWPLTAEVREGALDLARKEKEDASLPPEL